MGFFEETKEVEALLLKALTVCVLLAETDHEYATTRATIVLEEAERNGVDLPCREGVAGCSVVGVHKHRVER